MTTIKHVDMLACKFCNRGSRQFCQRHGISWQEFIENGIDESAVKHIDDAMLDQVIEHARQRELEGRS